MLDIGTIAAIMAAIRYFGRTTVRVDSTDVVTAFYLTDGTQLSREQWDAANLEFLDALSQDEKDATIPATFGVAFSMALRKLTDEQPEFEEFAAQLRAAAGVEEGPAIVVVDDPKPLPGSAFPGFELPTLDEGPDPALPPLPDGPEMRWARWAGVQGMGETEDVDVAMFRGAALPFTKGRPTPAFFAAADALRVDPRDSPGSTTGHETMMLAVVDLTGPADEGPGTESRPAAAGGEARAWLTVEQYAAFCAELAGFPARAAEIHRKYAVTGADARSALDDAFAQRFRADPTLRQRWQALVVHYGEWHRRQAIR